MTEESLFYEALAKPSAERTAFLEATCVGQPELRAAVEALLAAHEQSGNLLDRPPRELDQTIDVGTNPNSNANDLSLGVTVAYPSNPAPGMLIAGRYKLIEEIGEGGMGTVFMAQQSEPVKRLVAVKIIKPGMDSRDVLARFEAERQALALMDHPNIARVLDAGSTESGRPFFVMELVKGTPITQYCDQHKLTTRQRLELFLPVCQAIQHAHQKGVIHRDIKPSNVLVAMYDDRPIPKVIDFGLAKATGQSLTEKTLVTGFGALVGTPEYMSPEQANLNNMDIDTRSDIYALGVLLYELLTGSTPVDRKSLANAAVLEVLRIVREVDAPRASMKLSSSANLPSIAAVRGTEPARLKKALQGELDWVLMKALEKDRGRRYETANGLARDIQRYLADEVVEARPPSAGYRLRKFVRRNKGQVIAACLLLLALLAGIAGTTFGLFRARAAQVRAEAGEKLADDRLGQVAAEKKKAEDEKKRAEDEKQIAQAVQYFLQYRLLGQASFFMQADSLLEAGRPAAEANTNLTIRELLDRAATELAPEKIDASIPNQPQVQAAILQIVGQTYAGVGEYQRAIDFLQRAVAISRKELGPDDPETLTAMHNLAMAYQIAGKPELATALSEETFKRRKEKLGADDPETLRSMGEFAFSYQQTGKMNLALPLFEESLKLRKAKLGANDPGTLAAMNDLATGYLSLGKLDLALPLCEEAYKLSKAKLGPDHPNTITGLNNLAVAYLQAGKLNLAVPLFEEVHKLRKAKLGPDHPQTLSGLHNLAMAYKAAGKLDLALPLLEETLRRQKTKLAPDHPDLLESLGDLADAYESAGKLDLALPLLEETLKRRKAKLGPDHRRTLAAMANLANAYQSAGKLDLALPLLLETYEMRKATLGADDPATLSSMNNLAVIYGDTGKLDLAIPLYKESLALHKAKLGPDNPQTLTSMFNLARTYQVAGKLDLALPLLEETLRRRKSTLGADNLDTLLTMNNLATVYQAAGKLDLAQPLLEETLNLRKAKFGADNPETLMTMNGLAAVYRDIGNVDLALPLLEELLKLRKAKLGPEHLDTLTCANNVAWAYWKKRQFDKSIAMYEDLSKHLAAKLGRQHPETLNTIANLGVNYKDADRLKEALPLLEEAYRGSKKVPNIQWVSGQLLDCYVRTGEREKTASFVKEQLADARQQLPKDSLPLAGVLASIGQVLLQVKAFVEAEPLIRESLAIREKDAPDDWSTFNAKAMLGGALLGQKKLAEAEPLLLAGYRGMKEREAQIPPPGAIRPTEALERLVQLYDALGKQDEAAKWRKELVARNEAAKGGQSLMPAAENPPASSRQPQGK
jgi:tetratricopeptide (TPR) repeat protein